MQFSNIFSRIPEIMEKLKNEKIIIVFDIYKT